jgi:hypothetical protein
MRALCPHLGSVLADKLRMSSQSSVVVLTAVRHRQKGYIVVAENTGRYALLSEGDVLDRFAYGNSFSATDVLWYQ